MNQDENNDDGALAHQQEQEHQQWLFEQEYLIEQANQELNLMKKEGNHD